MPNQSVGTIGLDMVLNSKEFRGQLNAVRQDVNASAANMATSFKKIGGIVAGVFSAAAIKSFGQETIKQAASVQAANAQTAQTFGVLESAAVSAFKSVGRESGIVDTRLQGVGTSIYAFAKSAGMDSANAMKMMQEALTVTADSAAYYDSSLEDTAESLKSFLKGNYANDAALGISCTETTRNIAANKLFGQSFKDLSEAQKQLTLLQMVKDANALSGAMGQAARESDGWENVVGNLKETWNQFLAVVGKPILQGALIVIKSITAAISTLTEYARGAVSAMSKLFGWSEDNASFSDSVAQSAGQTAEATEQSAENQKKLAKETKKTAEAAKGSLAAFDKLNVLTKKDKSDGSDTESSDTVSKPSAAKAPLPSASTAEKSANKIADSFSKVFSKLYEKSGAKNFVDKFNNGLQKVNWGAINQNLQHTLSEAKPIAEAAAKQTQRVGNAALGSLGAKFGMFATVGGKALQTLSGGVDKWITKDQKKITKFINNTGDNLTTGFNNLSTYYDGMGTLIGDSIDRMRPTMENSIADLLSGLTTFGGSVAEIASSAFAVATGSLVDWINNDGETIGLFFDNLQLIVSDTFSFIGGVFDDIGTFLSDWWNGEGGGKSIFESVCLMFTNIGTTLMNVWNKWIMPVWEYLKKSADTVWKNFLKPVFESVFTFIGKLISYISDLWNTWLLPVVNWIVVTLAPTIKWAAGVIWSVIDSVAKFIGGVVASGIFRALGGILDFISGIFTGNWKKAWRGICDFFSGLWNGIVSILKFPLNLLIDAVNGLFKGIYSAFASVSNFIGGIAGTIGSWFGQDWGWEINADNVPQIPKLAKGGIVTAPTLAVIGDNAGAGSGNPEVVAPLSKLQGMINQSSGEDVIILNQILHYLKQLYELLVLFRNSGGSVNSFVAELDGNVIFEQMIKLNDRYKKRHNGVSAFL